MAYREVSQKGNDVRLVTRAKRARDLQNKQAIHDNYPDDANK